MRYAFAVVISTLWATTAYGFTPTPTLGGQCVTFTPVSGCITNTPGGTATPTPVATNTPTITPNLLVIGCPVNSFLPHAPGDTLTYTVTYPNGMITTETWAVDAGSGNVLFNAADQETDPADNIVVNESRLYSDGGSLISQFGYDDDLTHLVVNCTPAVSVLTCPLNVGDAFSSSVKCTVKTIATPPVQMGTLTRADAFTAVGTETVTVPLGTFANVAHLHGTISQKGLIQAVDRYYERGVGLIKSVETAPAGVTTRQLTSGIIGGVPVTP